MNNKTKFQIIGFLSFLFLLILFLNKNYDSLNQIMQKTINIEYKDVKNTNIDFSSVRVRDFMFYKCQNIVRIGGQPNYVQNAPNKLWRIDGAWYICLDSNLKPKQSDCNVISLGVNQDFSFDKEMRTIYNCSLYSYDPLVEAPFFQSIRSKDLKMKDSIVLKVEDKWLFYRFGVIGSSNITKKLNEIAFKDLVTLENLLEVSGLKNKVIDVFKMDIEGWERGLFINLDIDYLCKYFKNLAFETHTNSRTSRFAEGDTWGPTGHMTEFQNPKNFCLNITKYGDELGLAEFMFTTGEFYFVNINFI